MMIRGRRLVTASLFGSPKLASSVRLDPVTDAGAREDLRCSSRSDDASGMPRTHRRGDTRSRQSPERRQPSSRFSDPTVRRPSARPCRWEPGARLALTRHRFPASRFSAWSPPQVMVAALQLLARISPDRICSRLRLKSDEVWMSNEARYG